jgi:hypothetical protein
MAHLWDVLLHLAHQVSANVRGLQKAGAAMPGTAAVKKQPHSGSSTLKVMP